MGAVDGTPETITVITPKIPVTITNIIIVKKFEIL